MGFLRSLASNIGYAAPGIATALHNKEAMDAQRQAEADQEDETLRSNFFKGQANDRANAADARAADLNTATIAHLTDDDSWGKPVAAQLPSGETVYFQQNKRGETRQAMLGGQGSGAPSIPGVQATGNTPTSMAGPVAPPLSALGGKPSLASSIQAPQTPTTALQTTTTPLQVPGAPQPLRPVAKPVAAAKIDPNSQAGVDAAIAKAKGTAAARAANAPPKAAPRIDPLSAQGISADSAKAANHAALKPTGAAAATGAASGQTMQTMARMGMSFNDLKQAIDQMDRYETPDNLAKQTPAKQALAAAAEAHPAADSHGLTGSINNALGAYVGAKAGEKVGQDDPEYRTYLNNKQRVATAFTELLPRPNQQLLQLEKGLSGADVSWNPQLIKNIQARRRGGLDVLKNILGQQGMLDDQGNMSGNRPSPAGGGRGGAPAKDPGGNVSLGGGTPTREQQLWDAAVAKHGQAKVLQEFGPRPGGDE